MKTPTAPLVKTKELTKIYVRDEHSVRAVGAVDLQVYPGEFLVIYGPSGSGKTTLLNLIGGLDRPTSGTVMLDGGDLNKLSDTKLALLRRKKIGIIFQDFNLLPTLTASENVEVALAPTYVRREVRQKKVKTLLDIFNLLDRADHLPAELSMGEQQRVAIARALANDPPLVLADEPTGNVGPDDRKEIVAKLTELNRRQNVTLITMSTGTFPRKPSTRILSIKDGKIGSEKKRR